MGVGGGGCSWGMLTRLMLALRTGLYLYFPNFCMAIIKKSLGHRPAQGGPTLLMGVCLATLESNWSSLFLPESKATLPRTSGTVRSSSQLV